MHCRKDINLNIRTLAKIAGTSYSTVSRALNDSPLVKESTKQRIRNLARSFEYHVDFSAKSLAMGTRMIIGIVYPYHSLRPYESVYTTQAIGHMRHKLSQHGFDALIAGYGDSDSQEDDIARLIRQKKVDALIVFGYEISHSQIELLQQLGATFLLINPPPNVDTLGCDQIRIDHEQGGFLAGRRLLNEGRARLLCVTERSVQFTDRTRGFRRALEKYAANNANTEISYDVLVLENGLYETAYRCVEDRIDMIRKFDGVFVQSDVSSIGVLNCLLDYGITVPGSISVIGYDDIEWAQYTRPPLTTIHQPVVEMALLVTEGIVSMVTETNPARFNRTLDPLLVERESC